MNAWLLAGGGRIHVIRLFYKSFFGLTISALKDKHNELAGRTGKAFI
jgi:hypothetical protein